jgi:hypothetical protein
MGPGPHFGPVLAAALPHKPFRSSDGATRIATSTRERRRKYIRELHPAKQGPRGP